MRYTQNINLPIVEDNDLYSKEINNLAFEKIDEEIQGLADIVETLDSPENSIADVKKDINDIKSDVVDINEQLGTMKNSNRLFKPSFNTSIYFALSYDKIGGFTEKTLEELEEEIIKISKLYIDGIYIIIHIGININTNRIYVVGNDYVNKINFIIEKCKEYNIKLNAIKVHCEQGDDQLKLETINNSIGIENFKMQYKTILSNIISNFKNEVGSFIIFNELPYIYADDSNTDYAIECLNLIKGNNCLCSISTAGLEDSNIMTERLKQNIDFFAINYYPSISFTGLNGYNESKAVDLVVKNNYFSSIDYLKKYNKDIYITETGCADIEGAMAKPWYWVFDDMTTHNGEVQKKYLDVIFTLFTNVQGVGYWWALDEHLADYIKNNIWVV